MVSIDLDQQIPESFQVSSTSPLIQNSADVHSTDQDKSLSSTDEVIKKSNNVSPSTSKESKKLSIVLTKEMHRRAKMQAVQEDTTLKDLVVRLIEQHLDQEQ